MKFAFILLLSLALAAVSAPPQTINPDARIVKPGRAQPRGVPPQKPAAAPASTAPPAAAAADPQEVEALRADLAHMRVLLNQMRTNLAFVQTSDTPLKHQFDLNNEMWQALLGDMEKRLQQMSGGAPRR